jgi:hypothetical protein
MDPFSLLLVSLLLGIFLFKGTLLAATLLLERPIRRRFAAEPAGGEALQAGLTRRRLVAPGAINDIEQGRKRATACPGNLRAGRSTVAGLRLLTCQANHGRRLGWP